MKFLTICKNTLIAISIASLTFTAYAGHGNSGNPGNSGKAGKSHGAFVGKSHGKSHGNSANKFHGKNVASKKAIKSNRFTTKDRSTISDFSKANSFFGSSLPPGIAMNVARGKTLPPGIAKRELPDNLLSKLPARPGYEYVAVGDDVVLLDRTTGVVADILSNVLH